MGGVGSSRRPKYSPEVHRKIVEALKRGLLKPHAAQLAGIHANTLETWIEAGNAGDERYEAFAIEVEKAIAEDALRNQAVISMAAVAPIKGDWKAAAWNLERKFPRLYGARMAAVLTPQTERPFSPWKTPEQPRKVLS
jgi:transposase-like protein